MATKNSYVHLSIVYSLIQVPIFFSSAFNMLNKEELFRVELLVVCDISVKTSLNSDQS